MSPNRSGSAHAAGLLRNRPARPPPRQITGASLAFEVALDLDRILGVAGVAWTALHVRLDVAVLGAGNGDLVGIDVLAEPGNLVDAHDVGARHQRTAILQRRSDLGVGHAWPVDLAHKAEIRRTVVAGIGVVLAEADAAGVR